MADQIETVDASPTKRFFIEIITRDIPIIAAIMDLVDNSVDSARSLRPDGDLSGLSVTITANETVFSIEDNCAGIGVDNAKGYVFRMGRPPGVAAAPESIGQFGVGMKRALFKLGSAFAVESTSGSDSFTVDVNVAEWTKNDSDWTLPLTVHDRSPSSATGTIIIVDQLHHQVQESFRTASFLNTLRNELRSRHRLPMGNGLTVVFNGEPIVAEDSMVAMTGLIRPAARSLVLRTPDAGELEVRIVVGIAATPATVDEDAEPESQSMPAADAGWLVFGNGRLLLANDKTALTGWGSGRQKVPQYHNQYARFRGFVYMTARNASAIPWNTMKTSVDPDSPIWSQVLEHMIEAARGVIDMLNFAKVERQLSTKDMATPILDAIRSATPVDADTVLEVHYSMSIGELRGGTTVEATYPLPNPDLVESWKKIQYSVLTRTFEELASAINTSSAAEIGRLSFDAFHAANVEP